MCLIFSSQKEVNEVLLFQLSDFLFLNLVFILLTFAFRLLHNPFPKVYAEVG